MKIFPEIPSKKPATQFENSCPHTKLWAVLNAPCKEKFDDGYIETSQSNRSCRDGCSNSLILRLFRWHNNMVEIFPKP